MDLSETVSAISTDRATGNTTEVIIIEDEGVEPMTIIVWCIGGILLLALLSLLGRIILAKKKQLFEHFDYYEHAPVAENNRLFQIRIDGRRHEFSVSQSRDTVDLVPRSDAAVTDTPVLSGTTAEIQPSLQNQRTTLHCTDNRQQNERRQIVTRHLPIGEHQQTPSTQRTAQILRPDQQGSRATINGYIIRPPPYREVTSGSHGIPSVIVVRDQTLVDCTRRQMFSL